MSRAVTYCDVPAGTAHSTCRSCDQPIYWITTERGRSMPVDCEADEQCHAPNAAEEGLGISHFATCPFADQHRRPR